MTVEAALILPLLILFFGSLMGLVNLIRTFVILDGALQAAVREMAVYAYPLDKLPGVGEGLLDEATWLLPESWRFGLAERALSLRLEGTDVSLEQIQILEVEFPQGEESYQRRMASGDFDVGAEALNPGVLFSSDDAYLSFRYQPRWTGWLPGLEGGMVFRATERGWLKGQGMLWIADQHEMSIFDAEEAMTYVYVTRTGVKYHRETCRYLRKSKIPMIRSEALKTYQPCKVCTPP